MQNDKFRKFCSFDLVKSYEMGGKYFIHWRRGLQMRNKFRSVNVRNHSEYLRRRQDNINMKVNWLKIVVLRGREMFRTRQ